MLDVNQSDLLKLFAAVLIGAMIGIERELHNKAAGLRTITLICLGSTLFTIISLRSGDNRLVANIVSGVGFLGAGVILISGGRIRGMTTASSIWVAAAAGIAIGFGELELAAIVALTVLAVLWLFSFVGRMMESKVRETLTYEISYAGPEKLEQLEQAFKTHKLHIHKRKNLKHSGIFVSQWLVEGSRARHQGFVEETLKDPDIEELRY
jgi:putative Mg2+ transporter-C (MgtC) family protein